MALAQRKARRQACLAPVPRRQPPLHWGRSVRHATDCRGKTGSGSTLRAASSHTMPLALLGVFGPQATGEAPLVVFHQDNVGFSEKKAVTQNAWERVDGQGQFRRVYARW